MTLKLEVKRPILNFDGENDYSVIEPFTVYGWSEITIEELIYPVWPKANTEWSKLSMIGDVWKDYPSTFIYTDNKFKYTTLRPVFIVRKPDGSKAEYGIKIVEYVNSWVHVIRRFTEDREYSVWVNGEKKYSATVPEDYVTVLEWDPDTATYPERYKRFVLGANVNFGEWMTVKYGYLRIYKDKALTTDEIRYNCLNFLSPVLDGLVLWLPMDEGSGSTVYDRSGNGNNGTIYGATWSDWWWDETGHCVSLRRRIRSNSLEELDGELVKSYVKPGWMIRLKEDDYVKFMGLVHEVDRRHRGRDVERCGFKAYDYLIKYDRHVVYRLYQTGTKAGDIIKDLALLENIPINLNGVEDGDALLSPWEIQNEKALDIMKSVARGTNYWLRMKPCLSYLSFDGETGYGVVSSDPSLDLTTLIIEAMVRVHDSFDGLGRIFHRRGFETAWSKDPYQLGIHAGGSFRLIIGDGSTYNALAFGSWQLNTWYHVIGVVTGSELLGYVNGELKNSASQTITSYTVTDDAQFSASHPYRYEPFDVALIRVYDYNQISVSVDDLVSYNLENLMNPITDGLVLWLNAHKLENGTVPDLSGNGNSGTVYGGVSQLYEVYPQYANSFLLEFKPKVIA